MQRKAKSICFSRDARDNEVRKENKLDGITAAAEKQQR